MLGCERATLVRTFEDKDTITFYEPFPEAMSSSSSDCVEILLNTEGFRGFLSLRQLEGSGSSASQHVMPGLGHGAYVPELGRRINLIHQLTPDQRASLSNNVFFSINSYMADHSTEEGIGLTHRRSRHQPSEDRDPRFDQEAHNKGGSTSRSTQVASTSRPTDEAGPS